MVSFGMKCAFRWLMKLSTMAVRLGTSGLKVSKIILGTMSYGESAWQDWVLPEEEGIKHIKAA
jgi:aryl-alcohol dehydrogenase-like predicted oxidoreductase